MLGPRVPVSGDSTSVSGSNLTAIKTLLSPPQAPLIAPGRSLLLLPVSVCRKVILAFLGRFDAPPRSVASWMQRDGEARLDHDALDLKTQQPLHQDQARDHLQRCLQQPQQQPIQQVEPQADPQPLGAPRISLEAEVPEALFDGMRAFLRSRPDWDQYRVITSALAGFLFQNGCSDRCVAQHYLNGLFMKPGE